MKRSPCSHEAKNEIEMKRSPCSHEAENEIEMKRSLRSHEAKRTETAPCERSERFMGDSPLHFSCTARCASFEKTLS